MNMISMFHPIIVLRAVSPGVVQKAEWFVKWNTQPFQVSLKKSMPKTVRPAKMASQFPVSFAFFISVTYM